MRGKIKFNAYLIAIFSLLFFFVATIQAATLYPSPSSGDYNIGSSFSVNIYASSADQSMNAVSGTLSFPRDKLEVTSVSNSGSIVSLWVQEPIFSNSAGTVSFEGIVLNPGFKGSNGKILTVNFRTKDSGTADVTFSSGSILANDGQGTNILSGLGSARFSIEVPVVGPAAPEAESPSPITGTPPAPRIISPTHENPDNWYANSNPQFTWAVPAGITSTRLLVGKKSQASPTVVYVPAISSRNLEDLDDGVWYFHVQLRSNAGWGGITHFRFQIDTVNPEYFNISEIARDDLTNPNVEFIFEAEDATSGIHHYEIQIDDGEVMTWEDDGSGIYQTPVVSPGKHTLRAKAVDGAGNNIANFAEFTVKSLDTPEITYYTKNLTTSEELQINGLTYSDSQVLIWLQAKGEEPMNFLANSDRDGNFNFIAEDKLKTGSYKFWLQVIDNRGAQSEFTEKMTITVQRPAFWRIGSMAISVLSIAIPLIALIVLLIFMLWYSWHKLKTFRRRVGKEVGEAETALSQAFASLRKSVATRVRLLEKIGSRRKLTREEEKVVKALRKDLDAAQKVVAKEIRDIRKEVKK